jgi:predicted MFS family arabinose efflux permease
MKDAGFGGEKPVDVLYSMVFLGVVYLISNFICVMVSNKYGRRQLLLFVSPFIAVSMFLLSASMFINYELSMTECMLFELM